MEMKDVQDRVRKFCKENKLDAPVEHRMLDLVSEIGEIAKEILKASDYGKKQAEFREEIKAELGDALFSLLVLANQLGVSMEEALDVVLEKYRKRLEKGSAGSEVD